MSFKYYDVALSRRRRRRPLRWVLPYVAGVITGFFIVAMFF